MASDVNDGIKKERDPILMVGFVVLLLAFAVVCGVYVKNEYFSAEDNPPAFMGTAVKVDYTGSYYDFLSSDSGNAVVFDTSLWVVANGDSAKSYEFTMRAESNYSPLSFTIGVTTTYLNAFMNSAIGLKIGESAKVCIAPADGYGELTVDDLWSFDDGSGNIQWEFGLSNVTISLTDTMSLNDFKNVYNGGSDVTKGMVLSSPYGNGWRVQVTDVNSVNVTFENIVNVDEEYPLSENVSVKVTSVENGEITFNYVITGGLEKVPEVDTSIVSDGSDPTIFINPGNDKEYDSVKIVKIFYDGKFYFIAAMNGDDPDKVILRNAEDSNGGTETKGMYLFFDVTRV